MQRIEPTQIENPQQITVVVAGPDGANRLFVLDGQFSFGLSASNQATAKETFAVLLGPVLTRRQFVQAGGSAALTGFTSSSSGTGGAGNWQISSVDADWDDESGQVELRVEVSVWASNNGTAQANKVGYHVTILAEMQPAG